MKALWGSALKAFLVGLLVVACGGGGGGGNAAPVAPLQSLEHVEVYAYYGDNDTSVAETAWHVTATWAWGRGTRDPVTMSLERMAEAKAAGIKVILYPEVYHGSVVHAEAWMQMLLTLAKERGLLDTVIAVYTGDEPDVNGRSAEAVREINASVRKKLAEFGMSDVKLAVIYGSFGYPGIETFDWVGFDNYTEREAIFTNGRYTDFKARLAPTQRILLVLSGDCRYNQDPAAFEAKAREDKQVIGIVPFLWVAGDTIGAPELRGIRDCPMRAAYEALGQRIKANS